MAHAAPQPVEPSESVGSFNPLVLTRVMRQAARPEHGGALHVVSGPSVKTIRFGRGSVRFASSNIRRDRLGESMLAHDFISRSDFRIASDTMRREGCRFGEALVSMGRLTEDQLNRELAIQAQRIVLSLFRIEAGTYRLEQSAQDMPTFPFGLPVAPLLLKGLRSIKDGRLILSELPPAETLVRVSPTLPPGFRMDKLSKAERSVLDFAADGRTIGDIIRGTNVGRVDAFHGCFALLSLGLLERVPEPLEEAEAAQTLPDEADASSGPIDIAPSSDELEAALATLEPSASASSVTESPQPHPPESKKKRSRSRGVPSYNDLIRLQYDRLETVSEAGLLGVREDVGVEELESAYGELKREWTELRQQTDDKSLLLKLDAIERRLAAAYANMRFKCQNAAEPNLQLDSLFDAAVADAEAEADVQAEPQPRIVDAPSEPSVADARVEQLERDLELHFVVRDWSGAMSLLHELVTLQPDNPRYHAQLGTAMQHHSTSRVNAEQHFLEAVRLSPDDASLHLDLARYYHLMGNPARARSEVQKTLELDPGNEEAKKLLGAGKSPSTMKKLLKRMFGSS